MNQINWIFFDIGGVLADESAYQEFRHATCLAIASRYVPELTEGDYARAYKGASTGIGSLSERLVRQLLENAGKADRVNDALEAMASEFRSGPSYLEMEEVKPGARDVVATLAQKYRIGIIANQPEGIIGKLSSAGIMPYLSDCTLASDQLGKPSKVYYLRVLSKTGANPERSIMVDDNLDRGILPAKALGMTTVWFGQEDTPVGVDYAVMCLEDLLLILR